MGNTSHDRINFMTNSIALKKEKNKEKMTKFINPFKSSILIYPHNQKKTNYKYKIYILGIQQKSPSHKRIFNLIRSKLQS